MSEQANGVTKTFLSDEALVEAWRDKVYETTRSSRFDQEDYLLLVSMAEDNFKASLGIPNPAEFVRAARECEQAVRSVFPLMNATTLDAIAFELECPDPKRTTTTSAKCEFFRDLAKRLREADAALSAFRAAGGGQ